MNGKKVFSTVLLLFVVVSLVYLVAGEIRNRRTSGDSGSKGGVATESPVTGESPGAVPEKGERYIVYYFYGGKRCITCERIEKYTCEALDAGFTDEISKGKVTWKAIDTDKPENNHFIGDYQLVSKSVIISALRDGKEYQWKNLEKIWELNNNRDAYCSYIENELRSMMRNSGMEKSGQENTGTEKPGEDMPGDKGGQDG